MEKVSSSENSSALSERKRKSGMKSYLRGWGISIRRDYMLYLMLAPMIVWFILFDYKPLYGLQIAFKKYSVLKGILGSPWVGFENFIYLFSSDYFIRSVFNTLAISFLSLIFGFPIPIIVALMLSEVHNKLYRKSIQTIVYLPHFISIVIIAGIVVAILSPSTGVVNIVLEKLGFGKIYFLIKAEWFRTIFIGSNIWKEAGFSSIVYLAAILSINPSLYESAQVDGATRFQMITRITLPCILPTIAIILIIRMGHMLSVGYEYIILLYQPTTFEKADVISTYIYRLGLEGGQFGITTAAGFFNSVISLILVLLANRISRKIAQTGLF